MGSIIKIGNKYRAIVRVGEFRLNPIQKHFPNKTLAKRFIQAKEIEILNGKYKKNTDTLLSRM